MRKNRHSTQGRLLKIIFVIPLLFQSACQRKEKVKDEIHPPENSASRKTGLPKSSVQEAAPKLELELTTIFDSIGPGLNGDYNGDGVLDTVRAVHARSAQLVESAPFKKEVLDTTSPGEDLCGGWGVYLQLSRATGSQSQYDPIYFCGQQGRVQNFSWVGSSRVDTLPFPDLKTSVGKGVNDLISLFSQAGITVYMYYTGQAFKIYEPNEDP